MARLTGAMSVFTMPATSGSAGPTIVSKLDFTLPAEHEFALIRNGLRRETDGLPLAGAEEFTAHWSGVPSSRVGHVHVLVMRRRRTASDPISKCNHNKWRVNLRRGQKTSAAELSLGGQQAPTAFPAAASEARRLSSTSTSRKPPEFDERNELVRARTGFTVKYQGPIRQTASPRCRSSASIATSTGRSRVHRPPCRRR